MDDYHYWLRGGQVESRDSIFRAIQATFTDGIVAVVGSGLSCAVGLPSMPDLAKHLLDAMASTVDSDSQDGRVWHQIADDLNNGVDLESALNRAELTESLRNQIVAETGDLIEKRESQVLRDLCQDPTRLPFTGLVRHLMHVNGNSAHVVTTNYDRLVEISVEAAGYEVSTGHVGSYFARYRPDSAQKNLHGYERAPGKRTRVRLRPHITVHKPHGSIDWRMSGDSVIRSSIPNAGGHRLIITPGVSKYRAGYDQPFDAHIQSANAAIDSAGAFIVVGYGFNDDHLQTHLVPRIQNGAPTLVLAKQLTPSTLEVLNESTAAVGLELLPGSGTRVRLRGETVELAGDSLWDLESLVKTVLA